MTPEEKLSFESRIAAASAAEARIARLADALHALRRDDKERVVGLELNLDRNNENNIIGYRSDHDSRYIGLCWSAKEPGLREEIVKAVCDALERRLAEAREQLEKA